MKSFSTVATAKFAVNLSSKTDRGSGRISFQQMDRGSGRLKVQPLSYLRPVKADRGSGRIAA